MTGTGTDPVVLARIAEAIRERQRFVIASHVRPDGDAVGSEIALAAALAALGKQALVVSHDTLPEPLAWLPGAELVRVTDRVEETFDAAIVLECGDISRTGVAGLDRFFTINVDHHPGNTLYGAINWYDESAAACGEMVQSIVDELGVPMSADIALAIYVAILTDTGSFHYSGVSPRTFDICRRALEAGVDPVFVARQVYDSNSVPRLRLWAAVLDRMEVDPSGRLAILRLDHALLRETGATPDDTEGLINEPLSVRQIVAVVFFKEAEPGRFRVSFRSKGAVDVNEVAVSFGGGGHRNASGCSVNGPLDATRPEVLARLRRAIETAGIR